MPHERRVPRRAGTDGDGQAAEVQAARALLGGTRTPGELTVNLVGAHHERATLRVGDIFVKVDADDARIEREAAAIELARAGGIAVAPVRWRRPNVLAIGALPGVELGRLGEPSTMSPAAWSAAGAVAAAMHALPLPPWPGWTVDEFSQRVDADVRWLVDEGVVPLDIVERVRRIADGALRPFPLVFTHGDFQAAHVLVDGADVTGVIDWPDCVQGDALFDLAVLTVGHSEHLDDVLRGYGADVDRDIIRSWWALRRLLAVRWMVEHDFDATGDIAMLHGTARRG